MKLVNSAGNPWDFTPHSICMWDLHPYITERIGIPFKRTGNTIYLKGNFCSFPCLRSFLKHRVGLEDFTIVENVDILQKNFDDKSTHVAPSREMLTIFEGKLDIETFRNSQTVHVIEIPMEEISVIGVHHATCKDDINGEKNFSRKPFSSNHATEAIKQKLAEPKRSMIEAPTLLENFMCIQKRKLPHTHIISKKSKTT